MSGDSCWWHETDLVLFLGREISINGCRQARAGAHSGAAVVGLFASGLYPRDLIPK